MRDEKVEDKEGRMREGYSKCRARLTTEGLSRNIIVGQPLHIPYSCLNVMRSGVPVAALPSFRLSLSIRHESRFQHMYALSLG